MAKILIVDDDPDIVEAASLFLAREGHQIEGAHTRQDGMARLLAFQPDLLILDVMMDAPDDGFVMAQELRRQGHKLPILMLSSVASASGLAFGKDAEMVPVDAFVAKPVQPGDLVRKVAALLQGRED